MGRKLIPLIGVFIVLAGLAIYLSMYGRPTASNQNPLEKIDFTKITKLSITNGFGKIVLENGSHGWNVTAPVNDIADAGSIADILADLRQFSIGSMISENPAKHAQFMLDDVRGIHLQVFVTGNPKPVLDGLIGKPTAGVDSSYFRFYGSTPVYIVDGIPSYLLQRDARAFRSSRVLPDSSLEITGLIVSHEKSKWDLVKSSNTWMLRTSSRTVDSSAVQAAINKLETLAATDFAFGDLAPEKAGFSKPYLSVHAERGAKPETFVVGAKATASFPNAPVTRYLKLDGRDAILIVRDDAITNLVSAFKAIH